MLIFQDDVEFEKREYGNMKISKYANEERKKSFYMSNSKIKIKFYFTQLLYYNISIVQQSLGN
jgi:hypothetical protein